MHLHFVRRKGEGGPQMSAQKKMVFISKYIQSRFQMHYKLLYAEQLNFYLSRSLLLFYSIVYVEYMYCLCV